MMEEKKTTEELGQVGRAFFVVDERMLERMLQIPDDIHLRGVYFDPTRRGFVFHLEGERLPLCEQGMIPTYLPTLSRLHLIRKTATRGEYGTTYDVLLNGEVIAHIGWEHDLAAQTDPIEWEQG